MSVGAAEHFAFGKPPPDGETEWYPYKNKTVGLIHRGGYKTKITNSCTKMFLLDALDNMPRTRVSDALMKVFLWVLRESGVPDVPSLDRLREVQAMLRDLSGVPSKPHKSAHGNLFYMNDIRSIIAKVCHPPLSSLPSVG